MNWKLEIPEPPGGFALPRGATLGAIPGMIEDERMRAGKDRTLFAKEHRQDAEQMRQDADLNAFGIAFFQSVKPPQKELFQ